MKGKESGMKKYIALLLALVMVLLAACCATQPPFDGSAPSTEVTESSVTGSLPDTPTDGVTDAIGDTTEPSSEAPTDEPTTEPTEGKNSGIGDTEETTPSENPTEGTRPPETEPTKPVDVKVSINKTSLSLEVGQTSTLSASYNGTKSLTWSSDNTSVATVSNGKVTAKAAGTATIKVTDGSVTATCKITVNKPAEVKLSLNKTSITLNVGESFTVTATYSGGSGSPKWEIVSGSGNVSIAESGSSITVKGLKAGTAIVQVTYGGKTFQCQVKVEAKPDDTTTFKINTPANTEFYVGETLTIDYTYSGDKAALKVDTSNASILTVKNNGGNIIVTGVSEGKASVAIYSGSTKLGQVRLSVVNKPVEKPTEPEIGPAVSITKRANNGPWNSGMVGNYMSFTAVAKTADGDNRDVVATSSNTSVATVSCSMSGGAASITVSYKSAGSATITIKSDDGKVSDSFTINVSNYSSRSVSSPEEYAAAATYVVTANGLSQGTPGNYTVLVLSPGELSWSRALGTGQDLARRGWANGCRSGSVTYEGTNEDGNYVFHLRIG